MVSTESPSAHTSASYTAEFAVDMTCEDCEKKAYQALAHVSGVESVHVDLPSKRVVVRGKAPPSRLLESLRHTGLRTALQGHSADSGVCMLDTVAVARLIPVSSTALCVDVSLDPARIPPGVYSVEMTQYGDLSNPAELGSAVCLGAIEVPKETMWTRDIQNTPLASWIGRGMCLRNKGTAFCGVIARSAGAFKNVKSICTCSGKTIWEDQVQI